MLLGTSAIDGRPSYAAISVPALLTASAGMRYTGYPSPLRSRSTRRIAGDTGAPARGPTHAGSDAATSSAPRDHRRARATIVERLMEKLIEVPRRSTWLLPLSDSGGDQQRPNRHRCSYCS